MGVGGTQEESVRRQPKIGGFLESLLLDLGRYGTEVAGHQGHRFLTIPQEKHFCVQRVMHARRGLAFARAVTGQWYFVSGHVRSYVAARHTDIERPWREGGQ